MINADYRFVSQVLGTSYRGAANTHTRCISHLESKSGSLPVSLTRKPACLTASFFSSSSFGQLLNPTTDRPSTPAPSRSRLELWAARGCSGALCRDSLDTEKRAACPSNHQRGKAPSQRLSGRRGWLRRYISDAGARQPDAPFDWPIVFRKQATRRALHATAEPSSGG